jgi:hypothetical protein
MPHMYAIFLPRELRVQIGNLIISTSCITIPPHQRLGPGVVIESNRIESQITPFLFFSCLFSHSWSFFAPKLLCPEDIKKAVQNRY